MLVTTIHSHSLDIFEDHDPKEEKYFRQQVYFQTCF